MGWISETVGAPGNCELDYLTLPGCELPGVVLMGVSRNYQTYRVGHPGDRVLNGIPRELDGTSESWTPGCRLSPGYQSPGVAFIGYVGREVWCGGHRLGHT